MTKSISIECVKIRLALRETINRIFDGELADARIEDLSGVKEFRKHAEHCESCEALGKEWGRALWVRRDALQ